MRSLTPCLLLFCGFLFRGAPARADWVEMGARVKCDRAAAAFRILLYCDSSSGEAKVERGFQILKPGVSTPSCEFGKRSLRVKVVVIEPNARYCGGSGSAVIRSAAIDNVELINDSIAIGDDCENAKPVIDIKLHHAGGIATLAQCAGSSDDLLADPTGTPLCAHWAGEYDGKSARYARIPARMGSDPQVIPIYPTYAGETALTVSARSGYMTIVRLLLEHGADPLRPRVDGISPADIADRNQHPEIAALIREYAAKQQ